MNNRDATLQRYYRRIRSYLPCSRKQKKRIMGELHNRIADYLTENPETDLTLIEARFGKPESIAVACVDDMDTQELLHALRIHRKITIIVVAAVFIILAMWSAVVTVAYFDAHYDTKGYTETYIIES